MVRWEPYLWPSTPTATAAEVAAVERAWGAALPAAFSDVARDHQGESPEPGSLRVGGVPRTVECLLHFADRPAAWSLTVVDAELRDLLPTGVHPVATSTAGTFWCLDLRADPPSVLHADPDEEPEDALREVAPDFATFLARLHDGADRPSSDSPS